MASGSEVAAGAAQAAPLIPALVGRGQNKRTATGFYNQPGYDPNASNFGGYAGGLNDYRNELERRRQAVDGRAAFTADYGETDRYQNMGLESRGAQGRVANLMWQRASGQVPSIAEQQATRQMGQAVAAQGALAASARTPGGLALANQTRANNVANVQSGISNQAQINAAQERERAEQAAFGAFSGMRQGDTQGEALAGQRAQFQAQQQQANRNANDQRAFGNEQLEAQALGQSLNAKVANQGVLAGSHNTAEAQNQQTGNQNAQNKGLIETVGDFFKSDERTKYITSDFTAKLPGLAPGGGESALARMKHVSGGNWESGNGASAPESFAGQRGMLGGDPMGELQAHSNFATRFASDPTAGGMGSFPSDERAKREAYLLGRAHQMEHASGGKPDWEYQPAEGEEIQDKGLNPEKHPTMKAAPKPAQPEPMPLKQYAIDSAKDALLTAAGPAAWLQGVPHAQQAMAPKITSDFTAKMPAPMKPGSKLGLSRGGSNGAATSGDPDAPKMRFSASTGWYLPGSQAEQPTAPAIDDDIGAAVAEEQGRDERSKLAAQGNALDPMAQWQARFGDPEAEKIRASFDARNQGGSAPKTDSNSLEMRRIQAGFAKDQPEQPTILGSLGAGSRGLYEAQFGKTTSDERAKVKMPAPEHGPVADANRTMKGQPYVYKPEHTPPDQVPGEPNFGFMAQHLEKSPIAATAVKEDPSGIKRVDAHKLLKVLAAGVADLQEQQDETRIALAKGGKRKKAA